MSFSLWENVATEGPDEGRSVTLTAAFAAPSPRGRGNASGEQVPLMRKRGGLNRRVRASGEDNP